MLYSRRICSLMSHYSACLYRINRWLSKLIKVGIYGVILHKYWTQTDALSPVENRQSHTLKTQHKHFSTIWTTPCVDTDPVRRDTTVPRVDKRAGKKIRERRFEVSNIYPYSTSILNFAAVG